MSILLLGVGGGGGNILRSVKELFRRDVAVAQKADPKYADRLRRAVTARFLDTNAFSLEHVSELLENLDSSTVTLSGMPSSICDIDKA